MCYSPCISRRRECFVIFQSARPVRSRNSIRCSRKITLRIETVFTNLVNDPLIGQYVPPICRRLVNKCKTTVSDFDQKRLATFPWRRRYSLELLYVGNAKLALLIRSVNVRLRIDTVHLPFRKGSTLLQNARTPVY